MTAPADTATAPVRALVVMGVSGSGKSTVATLLAARLGWAFLEGDELHPPVNVAKMAEGVPLTDEDRAPWLAEIARRVDALAGAGDPVVVTCSALRRRYRDVLRRDDLVFVHLAGSQELIAERLGARTGHFMPATLLDSQFEALEPLGADERHVTVDLGGAPEDEIAQIVETLGLGAAA
ncbi:gluconokinase [Rathayibacter sp. VKM Ac-2760]|uniref:gluconokinase n=1 Tax=Rathayibacter sp. VKM Ac-2760 TaxID=2609253 RepID=UPI001319AD56|nr:gluconokinase [Rathayibacter sp. VKM Ac-2760]QHC58378.1 AAA family ATPase [Rathayibacter sp. VKM Ac-2760]